MTQSDSLAPDGEMRQLTGVLRPVERLHPVEATLAGASGLEPVAIHQVKLLEDGTCIALLQVRGNLDTLDDVLGSDSTVLQYAVAGETDGFVYLQSESHELNRYLLSVRDDSEMVVQLPMYHTGDGGLRGTIVGTDVAFQRAVEALPDDIDIEVERIGDYRPEEGRLFSTLTDRQREILGTAVELGYYEDPRRASQRNVAAELDIAAGTVGQHLRRIEAKVFAAFVHADGSE